jgi:hypothetical protein
MPTPMNKHRILKNVLLIALIAIPALALAQTTGGTTGVAAINDGLVKTGGIITALTSNVVKALATLFATAAMTVFFFGIVQYIWGVREGDATRIEKGNLFLRWGLVALFVMFSVWGIIIYVQKIFGIDNANNIIIPTIQLQGGTQTGGGSPLSPTCPSPQTCPDGVTKYCNAADIPVICGGGGTQSGPPAAGGCAGLASETQRNACFAAQGSGGGSPSSSGCAGKADGVACTIPGFSGAATCGTNDAGTFGCYAVGGGGGTSQTVYYCSDGTPYYNVSDRTTACAAGNANNSCAGITDGQTCQSMGCQWSNSEGVCSTN